MRVVIYHTFTGHGIVLKDVVWYYCSGDANGLTIGNTARALPGYKSVRLIVSPIPGPCLELMLGSVRCRRILRESASQVRADVGMELHLFTCVLTT